MTVDVRDRILDAVEELICARGIASFTLDAVAQAAEISKGGLLYYSKDCLIAGIQQRMALRMADAVRDAEGVPGAAILAFVRHLRREHERGERTVAALLLVHEREKSCEEMAAVMICIVQDSVTPDGNGSLSVLLAALESVLSSLARIPLFLPRPVTILWDDLKAEAQRVVANDPSLVQRSACPPAFGDPMSR
jgi:AcrR family transcriptional regulator